MEERTAARSKRPVDYDEAPTQTPMRGVDPKKISRNPGTDQKRIRHQIARNQKTARSTMSTTDIRNREAQILAAMASATTPERQALATELEHLRSAEATLVKEASEIDLANSILADHFTPVPVHEHHTAATDWVGEVDTAPLSTEAVTAMHHQMLTEASLWFESRSPEVRSDREEFAEQVQGMARRIASSYGEAAPQAARAFLDHVAHLYRVAGADSPLVSDKAAVGDDPNAWKDEWPLDANGDEKPNTVPWSEQMTTSGNPGEARPSDRTSSRRTAADPQSGQGISTLDPGHPVDAELEPFLHEDWPGGEAAEKPSTEAPNMRENAGGPTGGPNDSTFGGDSTTKESNLARRDGETLIAWQARLTTAGRGVGASPVPFGDRPVRSVAGVVCPRCGAGRSFVASGSCTSCGFKLAESTEPGKEPDFEQSGEARSTLPYDRPVDEQNRPAWPWELDANQPGTGAADVANTPNPNDHSRESSLHTAVDSSGHNPRPQNDAPYPYKDGATSTCHECGRPVQAMEGIWYHLKDRSASRTAAEMGSDSPTTHLEEVTQPETTDNLSDRLLAHPPGDAARSGGPAPYNAAPPLPSGGADPGHDGDDDLTRQTAFRQRVQASLRG